MTPTSKATATPTAPRAYPPWNPAEPATCPAPATAGPIAAPTAAASAPHARGVHLKLDTGLGYGPRLEASADQHGASSRIDAFDGNAGPLSLSLGSSRAQFGAQNEAASFLLRLSATAPDGRWSNATEVYGIKTGGGTLNPDGSEGVNMTATASAMSWEGTWHGEDLSLTAGVGVGVGLHGSLGVRDRDGDHRLEGCVRASIGLATIGLCIEE
ncbi:MAG: hypothetical protein IPG96_18000 [Proteobacteria bacterium]|nr:hypothetical protein [Pseudomonadota bacterium]